MIKFTSLLLLMLAVALSLGMTPTADAASVVEGQQGPHGGMIVNLEEGQFEIVIDEKDRTVDVYAVEKPKKPIIHDVAGIRLTQKGSSVNAYLKTADPWKGLPHYQGVLPPGAAPLSSQIDPAQKSPRAGLEIEIRWGRQSKF